MGANTRRVLTIGGAVLGVVLAALAGLYVVGGRGPNAPSGTNILARLENGIATLTQGITPVKLAKTGNFFFRRVEVDTTKPQAEACLVFTGDLDASGKTRYGDYISIDPKVRVATHVVDTRLCLAGLDFNTTYNVTLKKGLPSAAGDTLTEEETVPVELRDKPSIVRFSGGIVLPRENAQGVPVTTVNISKLRVKLIRVGDRLLSQIESGVVDQTSLYNWNDSDLETSQGKLVWSGTMDVNVVKNDSVVTLIPINQILKDKKPGAYVLLAMDAAKKTDADSYYESDDIATQWVIDSDIALTTFQGANGLTVFARSYASAAPLANVKLALVARDNNELATVTTDKTGRADFEAGLLTATGGEEPVVVMAYGADQDFSFLDLRRPAFDLTDRGVAGRETPGPIDAFLYTERGVYRPGETVQLTGMVRDRVGAALTAPLTLVATRPDGLEVSRTTIPGASLLAGAATWALPLSHTAPHGRWQIAAYVDTSPKAQPVGRVQFDVQDFVPQKLKITLTPETPVGHPNSDIKVKVESRFLYGAPASGLTGEGEARIVSDSNPFADWSGWQFGRVDDTFSDVSITMTVPQTDAAGVTEAVAAIGELAETTLPLKAMMKIAIHEPGGRTTNKTVDVPVRTRDEFIGIQPRFEGGSVAENAPASFEAVAVNGEGKRIALSGLTYSWVREDTTYQWFQDNGQWKYQSVTRDRLVTSSKMSIGASGAPPRLSQALPWGSYRLTITDPKTGAASSYRFYSGWAASASGDRPDRIPVASDKAIVSRRRNRAREHQADDQRQGARRRGRRPRVLLATDRRAGRRRGGEHPRLGRLGAGRLCAGHRLQAAQRGHGPRAGALHRTGVARCRQFAAHLDRADRRTGQDHAAPEDHHSGDGEGIGRGRRRVADACRGGRRHPPAHRFQVARSEQLVFRQAPPRRRRARRLRPPDQGREGAHRLHARRRRQFRRTLAERRADEDGRAVLGPREDRRRRHRQRDARRARLQRRASPDGRGHEQGQARPCRPAADRARSGGGRHRAAALPGARRSRARGAQHQQCRGRRGRLHRDRHGQRAGRSCERRRHSRQADAEGRPAHAGPGRVQRQRHRRLQRHVGPHRTRRFQRDAFLADPVARAAARRRPRRDRAASRRTRATPRTARWSPISIPAPRTSR